MQISVDRSLPVSIATQVQGQIEFGVSCGELPPGSQLPSVRELAAELGVSPVTVSQVYKALKDKALIATKPGLGTFVREADELPQRNGAHVGVVYELIDRLIRVAECRGLDRSELSQLVSIRLGRHESAATSVRIVFAGIFEDATRSYVADLRPYLPAVDDVEATTFTRLSASEACRRTAAAADLVVTMPHRINEARELLGDRVPLVSLSFIPSERTRAALAEIGPLARVGLISTFPEFLATFKLGVRRFAPHVDSIHGAVLGTTAADEVVETSDVIVYATGSQQVMDGLAAHVRAFEYRHVPDPRSIERVLLPRVAALRGAVEKPAATAVFKG